MKRFFIIAMLLGFACFGASKLSADPGTGTLFGTNASGHLLISVNPATGLSAFINFLNIRFLPSLATDPRNGTIYAGTGRGNPKIYTVTTTGIANLVGDTNLGNASVGSLDFRADGTLFAAVNIAGGGGTGSDHLATINKTTGVATLVGPFGICAGVPPLPVDGTGACSIEGMEGIAFDSAGNLWGSKSTRGAAGAPGLYSINPATGQAAFVAPILDAGGNPPSGGVVSLQFACNGTLFGGTASGFGVDDGGFLVTINPGSGSFAFVGGTSATDGRSLGSLAFELSCIRIEVNIDIKFCSDPNAFNCKNRGNTPVTIFGDTGFDVTQIDIATVKLCLASDTTNCVGPPEAYSTEDRGDPTTDLGANTCSRNDTSNPDGFTDIDVAFDSQSVATLIDCDSLNKGESSPTLVIYGELLDGTPFTSVPIGDSGIDQLVRK